MSNITFIGDRPARICAIIAGGARYGLQFTGDRANPFDVYELIEAYIAQRVASLTVEEILGWPGPARPADIVLLSTGLTWAPRYDGMVIKQARRLLAAGRTASGLRELYVLGVSTRLVNGHELNQRIRQRCVHGGLKFIGGFDANALNPTRPTPIEALAIIERCEA